MMFYHISILNNTTFYSDNSVAAHVDLAQYSIDVLYEIWMKAFCSQYNIDLVWVKLVSF
jgi:hypothetical protein